MLATDSATFLWRLLTLNNKYCTNLYVNECSRQYVHIRLYRIHTLEKRKHFRPYISKYMGKFYFAEQLLSKNQMVHNKYTT